MKASNIWWINFVFYIGVLLGIQIGSVSHLGHYISPITFLVGFLLYGYIGIRMTLKIHKLENGSN